MNKTLTHAEYQARLKSITTPEEAAAFAQELLAPVLADLSRAPEPVEEPEAAPAEEEKPRTKQGRRPTIPELASRQNPVASPWYEVAANDKEAMVISLYAKGLTTRDIASYMKSHHGVELSQPGVSTITDKVFPLVKEWQSRPLSSCYPVMYLDGLHFKVRDGGKIASKVAYIALGVNQYGMKEVMGIWVSDSESAKFWMGVLSDMKNRGVDDILIVCVDGLKGFPEAIKAIYPLADVQVCVVHMIRHTVMFIPHKDREAFCKDLQLVYTAPSEEAGREALREVGERWSQYKAYLRNWEDRWEDIAPFFSYPAAIRRMIYTTNAIENLNRQFRKVTKTTTVFPHDEALMKLLWLAQADITQGKTLAVRNWNEIMAQLTIAFPDRVQF
ncbi:MAG: IS256 family transposase [Patescibacteria group bacterium]|nr:IS256 family transposase [Patescibacteria group bacterium]MDE1944856.1 IS256 family transposase [Patescibacteria group bacterium]MDE2057302.1 IS256 family transposase [Patescibacteria group bacterium]